ncbi:MAG: energy-coupling factor transporter transmembrane component T family protein [Bacilli bacterium]
MPAFTIGRYIPYRTFMHRLDPRFKLFGMLTLMVTIFFRFGSVWTDLALYGFIFILMVVLMRMTKLRLRQLFKQLKALWFMLLFLLIINLLLPNTQQISGFLDVFGIKIYYAALLQTFYIVFRLVLMIALTLILTSSTRPLDLTDAIEWYLTPLKVIKFPTHEVAMTMSIALRFIPTLLEETYRIMKAQASRGVDFMQGKIKEKIRAIVSLIVPLFISAFQRSEELANAMEARGYDPGAKRTRYRQLRFHLRDGIAFSLTLLYLGGFLYLWVIGFTLPV